MYISNAYELFILNKRGPLLDVNMARVLSRYFNPKEVKDVRNEKELQELSKTVINVKNCKELNWAILDFAALVCKSRSPNCSNCVIKPKCKYFNNTEKDIKEEIEESQLSMYYDDRKIEVSYYKHHYLVLPKQALRTIND